jgi:molybdopterin adenylyltransferase
MRAALLTISSSKAAGEGRDESGERLAAFAARLGAEIAGAEVLSDDRALIESRLCHWADEANCDLVLTSGGTGFAPSDVTPEATRASIEREAPGIAEAMRAASRAHSRHWMLSRGLAGIRGRTLIVNFPGSPASIDQAGEAIAAALPHALDLIAGRPTPHSDSAAASEGIVGTSKDDAAASGSGAAASEGDPPRVASRE